VIYTSGTTGMPKGAVHSHAGLLRQLVALGDLWGVHEGDVTSLALPLFHVHGLCVGLLATLRVGGTVLLHAKFREPAVVADFAERGATLAMWVPTMVGRLLAAARAEPAAAAALGRARLLTVGSAALTADDLDAFEQHTGQRLLERYGMTETLITCSNPARGERRAGSVGPAVPGAELRVVDDDGSDLPPGARGELWVRAPWMFSGYLGGGAAPGAAGAGPDATPEGWFATGDVVERDVDGYVRIVGRRSVDIIKSGGFKISAREIEEVLAAHAEVAEVAVVGVPDATWGERVVAAVVPGAAAAPALEGRLVDYAATVLADYKRPRTVVLVGQLPRNALGKVLKVELRASLAS
jgi:acyl-CoA synthetase (AMP-forming)/AMP-acid ligase II